MLPARHGRFGAGRTTNGANFVAVAGANLDVSKVERLAIVGGSGCGKTTAARMLLRLIEPDSAEFEPRD
jgi:ABC-type glutathione transport system ATPase component